MLGIIADGEKLSPYIILKRKTIPTNEILPKAVVIHANEIGRMMAHHILDWIKVVWNRRRGRLRHLWSFLPLDTFKGRLHEDVENLLQQMNTDFAIILSEMTSQLQPLDISVNIALKGYLREDYEVRLQQDNLPLNAK